MTDLIRCDLARYHSTPLIILLPLLTSCFVVAYLEMPDPVLIYRDRHVGNHEGSLPACPPTCKMCEYMQVYFFETRECAEVRVLAVDSCLRRFLSSFVMSSASCDIGLGLGFGFGLGPGIILAVGIGLGPCASPIYLPLFQNSRHYSSLHRMCIGIALTYGSNAGRLVMY